MFTGYCKEENHPMKLEYYCKNHNQLYCSICLCKLNKFLDGQYKDCEVCPIQDIKDEKLSEKNIVFYCAHSIKKLIYAPPS